MKIILTTAAPDIELQVDARFGRGAYLLTVSEVEGVTEQNMEIVGYIQAEELTSLIKEALVAK